MKKRAISAAMFVVIGACTQQAAPPDNVRVDMGQIETSISGSCFATDTTPAIIETVTVQEVASPAVRNDQGVVVQPATFRTVTRQNIVRDRQVIRFETVCPPTYTSEFVATLQRALAVRGIYAGEINGILDATTSAAIQRFQREDGPDTGLLSIETARRLGLVALDRSTL